MKKLKKKSGAKRQNFFWRYISCKPKFLFEKIRREAPEKFLEFFMPKWLHLEEGGGLTKIVITIDYKEGGGGSEGKKKQM